MSSLESYPSLWHQPFSWEQKGTGYFSVSVGCGVAVVYSGGVLCAGRMFSISVYTC